MYWRQIIKRTTCSSIQANVRSILLIFFVCSLEYFAKKIKVESDSRETGIFDGPTTDQKFRIQMVQKIKVPIIEKILNNPKFNTPKLLYLL